MSNKDLIEIGCIIGIHGIKGEVKLKSYAENPENIFSYKEIFLENDSYPIKFKFLRKVKQNFICEIENVKTRNDAEKFRNSKLFIKRDSLPSFWVMNFITEISLVLMFVIQISKVLAQLSHLVILVEVC